MDPMEVLESQEEADKSRLNSLVAVTIAILATFMGICAVKAGNVAQAMEQQQAERVNRWGYFQAKNTQSKLFESSLNIISFQTLGLTGEQKTKADQILKDFEDRKAEADKDKAEQKENAEKAEKKYDDLNNLDDQFDMSDAMLAISISLLAVTALTQKRFLFWFAMLPTAAGIYFGLAALLGIVVPSPLAQFLGA